MAVQDPKDDWEGQINQAREHFKVITELRQKLEILIEHVDSRKEALEEEIEESLHEAIRNSRDCLEKIQENVEPKLEKVIREKLAEIDIKMNVWKEEGLLAVREELKKETPAITKTVLAELETIIVEKTKAAQVQLASTLKEEVRPEFDAALAKQRESLGEEISRSGKLTIFSLLLSSLALAAVAMLLLR